MLLNKMNGAVVLELFFETLYRHGIDGVISMLENVKDCDNPCVCILMTGGCSVGCPDLLFFEMD